MLVANPINRLATTPIKRRVVGTFRRGGRERVNIEVSRTSCIVKEYGLLAPAARK
jgi:hypothetical protein